MGGTWLTQEFKDYIIDLSLQSEKAGKKIGGTKIHKKLLNSPIVMKNGWDIPTVRTVQNIIRDFKIDRDKLPKKESIQQGDWSLYNLKDYPMPIESIHVLLQLWRYAVNTYQKFSIRQAKWASRLYLTITDITDLWFESYYLADAEYRAAVSGYPMNDFKTLYYLLMKPIEQHIPLLSYKEEMHKWQPYSGMFIHYSNIDDGIIEEEPIFNLDFEEDYKLYERDSSVLFGHLIDIPSSQVLFKNINYRMIYLRHLCNLSKAPEWNSLNKDEVIAIILSLRQWVKQIEDNPEQINNGSYPGNPELLYAQVGIDLSKYDLNPNHIYDEDNEFFNET